MRLSRAATLLAFAAVAIFASPTASAGILIFNGPTTYTTGFSSQSIATGDFNHDGKLDFVLADLTMGTVTVALGNGDGTFQPHAEFSAGTNVVFAATGDVNNDGKLDIIALDGSSHVVNILLGNGDGTFQLPIPAAAVVPQPSSASTCYTSDVVAVADFNHDGKLDLAVTNFANDEVTIMLGNGDSTFGLPANYATGGCPDAIAIADFNSDTFADLAVANYQGGQVSILLGNGDGTFQSQVKYLADNFVTDIHAADFNGDGKLDIVVQAGYAHQFAILLNQGTGTFAAPAKYGYSNAAGPRYLAVGDFDHNGTQDIYISQASSLWLGKGDGTFSAILDNRPMYAGTGLATADLNGDGYLDMVSSGTYGTDPAEVSVLLNSAGIATSGIAVSPSSVIYPTTVVNSTSKMYVVMTSYGSGPLTITGNTIGGSNSRDFSLPTPTTCITVLQALKYCVLEVDFTPTARNSRTSTLTITDDAPGSPQTVSLTGAGSAFNFSTTSLSFGNVKIGSSSQLTVTITNEISQAVTINPLVITGKGSQYFSQTNTCGSSLAGNATCTITVTFTPLFATSQSVTLNVPDSAGPSPQTVSLSGYGVK